MDPARLAELESQSWEQVTPLVRRKAVDAEQMTLTRYSFAEGGEFPQHVHPQEQLTYVLTGAVMFTVAGERFEVREGDVLVIPSRSPHGGVSADGAEMICVVSPSRAGGSDLEILDKGVL